MGEGQSKALQEDAVLSSPPHLVSSFKTEQCLVFNATVLNDFGHFQQRVTLVAYRVTLFA